MITKNGGGPVVVPTEVVFEALGLTSGNYRSTALFHPEVPVHSAVVHPLVSLKR